MMGHTYVPHHEKVLLDCSLMIIESCCSVCSLAIAGVIGNELSDIIDAFQVSKHHVTADLWLLMATC